MDDAVKRNIINYLEMMPGNSSTFGPSHALMRYGRWIDTYTEMPPWMPAGVRRQCYGNCVKALVAAMGARRDDIHYAEGYAISKVGLPIPIQHAWLVDGKGRVIDPTWRDHADHLYFGVAFDTEFVIRMLDENGCEPGLLAVPSLMRRRFGNPPLFEAVLAENRVLAA
jgi:hypothetical protein